MTATGVNPTALREARERAGLTQHELARRVGVAGGERVSRWELGTAEPRPDTLLRIAGVLGMEPMDLLRIESPTRDLRALRYIAGLTAETLADRAHVSSSTYLRWESGRWNRLPSPANLETLKGVLEVDMDTLITAFNQSRSTRQHEWPKQS